jgi:hypothetical protein
LGTNGNAPSVSTPAGITVFAGDTAQIPALVAGSPVLTFQWYTVDSTTNIFTKVNNGGQVSGATNTTLIISNLTVTNTTNYVLVASNNGGATTSSPPTALTVYPIPAGITLNYSTQGTGYQQEVSGSDWNTTGVWWDGVVDGGLPASTLVPLLPTVPFVVPAGSELRTPSTGAPASATFPGSELDLDGTGVFTDYPYGVNATVSGIMVFKGGPGTNPGLGEVLFTNLVINGGQVDQGKNGVVVFDGGITIGANNAYFYLDNGDPLTYDSGFQINSLLSGSGTIQVNLHRDQHLSNDP